MPKALDWVIGRYPGREKLVRKHWEDSEDFVELCEHFSWMSEAASYNQNPSKAGEYATLRDKLKTELDILLGAAK